MTILKTALEYLGHGINVLPIRTDGSKAPAAEKWESFHSAIQTTNDVQDLFGGRDVGIAIVCGTTSGGLEVIDFDIGEAFLEWRELVSDLDPALYESLTIVKSPRGYHVYVRSDAPAGNKKLASTYIDGKKKTKVETRGQGGYVLAPGCPPSCHETGLTYELISGSFATIPRLTQEQRTILIDAARSLNEVEERISSAPEAPRESSGDRPGDIFEARATWEEILLPWGWTVVRERGGITYWCRPGKSRGISATTGVPKCGGKMFIFSSNADPFEDGRAYSRFAAYVALEHKGDASAAAKALRARGYKAAKPVFEQATGNGNLPEGTRRLWSVPPPPENEVPLSAYENDAPPIEHAPPPSDDDGGYMPLLTAQILEDMLDDDPAAWVRPSVFPRIVAVRAADKAEFELVCDLMRRRKKAMAFKKAIAEHDKQQQKKQLVSVGEWQNNLILRQNKDGSESVETCTSNLVEYLTHHPDWLGVLGYDTFTQKIVTRRNAPFVRRSALWQDQDATAVKMWFERNTTMRPTVMLVIEAVVVVAHANEFSAQIEYLENLPLHDGQGVLDTWLIDCFGAPDTPYTRAVGRMWMIGAVARAMNPGCKVDTVLVLEGKQGLKKSRALKQLCPYPEWFADGLSEFGTTRQAEEIEGKWIIELGELKGVAKDIDQTKAFITRESENYRPAYARFPINSPRKCVFAGTVNPGNVGYLKDETGNRRFWPVTCTKQSPEITAELRDKLWTEAKIAYEQGEIWWFEDDELLAAATAEQQDRTARDPWHETIEQAMIGQQDTSTEELLTDVIKLERARWEHASQQRVGRVMAALGWSRKKVSRNGRQVWRYFNPIYFEQQALALEQRAS